MPPDLAAVEGPYLRDILDQPRALTDTLRALRVSAPLARLARRLAAGRFPRVVLTGMGSSFHVLHPLHLEFVERGLGAVMVETSELIHHQKRLLDPGALIVAVSQSGRSAEMVRLLQMDRGHSPVIAVTNTAGSPLARGADAAILTKAGREFSVSCKTYTSALLALDWLGGVLCGGDLRPRLEALEQAAPAVSAYLAGWQAHVRSLASGLKGVRHLFLVGRGASLAAVGTGALILKESDHFHAEGMSSAAFRHGPFDMLRPDVFVMVFAGDGPTRRLNAGLLRDIHKHRGRAELVGEEAAWPALKLPTSSSGVRPVLEVLPAQMVSLALAAQAGREPGRFALAAKVTTTE
jgi:glucosamine--fructose-6-phosphate aminotransferase (isomerizing)